MWTCIKCQHENNELSTSCEGCGTTRSAGRFSSGSRPQYDMPPQSASQMPVVSQPRTQRVEQVSVRPANTNRDHPAAHAPYVNDKPRKHHDDPPAAPRVPKERGSLTAFVGGLLCVLLPLLCLLLAWRQYDAVSPVVLSLFFAEGAVLPEILKIAVYCALTLVTALVSLLPGLWTIAFARGAKRR